MHRSRSSRGSSEFQFTHPGRGATPDRSPVKVLALLFQFTHPGRGATQFFQLGDVEVAVSIHAPREGCDDVPPVDDVDFPVSIHAPREGCDGIVSLHDAQIQVSIHAPREGCDTSSVANYLGLELVSIHAPREGCDARILSDEIPAYEFQFTHPGRGATPKDYFTGIVPSVSIHAPREGCDDIDDTPLIGERLVSIHAPREGCDVTPDDTSYRYRSFNSRTPGGVRRCVRGSDHW